MDEGSVRQYAERHALRLRNGDLTAAFGDLTDEAKLQLEPYVLNFPSPVEEAGMVSMAPGPDGYKVVLRVSGGGREIALQTTWAEVDGQPKIVDLRGAGEPTG